jgi:hypothetical protein
LNAGTTREDAQAQTRRKQDHRSGYTFPNPSACALNCWRAHPSRSMQSLRTNALASQWLRRALKSGALANVCSKVRCATTATECCAGGPIRFPNLVLASPRVLEGAMSAFS